MSTECKHEKHDDEATEGLSAIEVKLVASLAPLEMSLNERQIEFLRSRIARSVRIDMRELIAKLVG